MVYVIASDKQEAWSSERRKVNKSEQQNIYSTIKFFIIFSQMLGLLPQENVTSNLHQLHFQWKSWKVLYTLVLIVLTSFAIVSCFLAWFYIGYDFSALATLVFYIGSLATLILYLRLAKSWSQLMNLWCQMDDIMNETYGYPEHLDRKLLLISLTVMSLGVVDYFLSILNRYTNEKLKWGQHYNYRYFFTSIFPQLFQIVSINGLTVTYCSILNMHATLMWAFNDVFIIMLSTALAVRFKQITKRLSLNYKKNKSEDFWIGIRQDYDRLSILCKELDDHISFIVLLSFSLNIFFLLVQLYHSLETVHGVVEKIYFVYSFVYLILKVVSVSLYAASINDESLGPTDILNSVSSISYNVEVRRLLMQMNFDNIALTGCRMFKVTRGIILSIAGAVVTYELVLIQFNQATEPDL